MKIPKLSLEQAKSSLVSGAIKYFNKPFSKDRYAQGFSPGYSVVAHISRKHYQELKASDMFEEYKLPHEPGLKDWTGLRCKLPSKPQS